MSKIQTAQIREEVYYSLTSRGLFSVERDQRHMRVPPTDQHILNESNTSWKNLAMAWIGNKKALDMAS